MINKDVLDQVFNSWNDMDKYNQIKVPISFVSSDKAKLIKDIDTKQEILKNKTKRKMAIKVPAFAIRGQVTGRNPFATNIGTIYGLKNCDKVAIYRTKEKMVKCILQRLVPQELAMWQIALQIFTPLPVVKPHIRKVT